MNIHKSLLLFLAMLTAWAWPASAECIVGTVTAEDLEIAGISTEKTAIPGGTVILSNDAGELRLAYDDDWGSSLGYGTSAYQSMTVGDSGEFDLGRAVVGNTNPTFVSYEQGVMTAGAVFELTAKRTGWMTVLLRMAANKQYVVFEGRTRGIPYTLGMANRNATINYSLPATVSGDIDFDAPDASKYFTAATKQSTNSDGIPLWIIEDGEIIASEEKPEGATPVREEIVPRQNVPQYVYYVAGLEDASLEGQSFTGFLTFRVTAGMTYYFSALGSKVGCGGFVFTEGNVQPKATFPGTDELPEVKFDSVIEGMPLSRGDIFEYDGLKYAVIDPNERTCKTMVGSESTQTPGNDFVGDLIIPETVYCAGQEYTVTEIGYCGFFKAFDLTSVVVPPTITAIPQGGFSCCYALTGVSLPETLKSIGMSGFNECKTLESIRIPEGVTSLDKWAFANCRKLSEIWLPSTLESVLEYTFQYDREIKTVNYAAENPLGVEGFIFEQEAYDNATLYMSNANLSDIQATAPWNKFKKIVAKDGSLGIAANGDEFEYEGVWYTIIDTEAKTCGTRGQQYDYEAGNYVAGNNCTGDLIIPEKVSFGQSEYSVIEIGIRSFKGNELTSVTIPEGVTAIGVSAFDECRSLTTVHLPESLTEISGTAFQVCINLSSINWPSKLKKIDGGAFNYCHFTSLDLPEGLEEIGKWAFQGNPLSSVSIPASLTSIEEDPFNSCTGISEVDYAAETPVALAETLFPAEVYARGTLKTPNATLASIQAVVPWNRFAHIIASDGSIGFVADGDEFEYEGVWYTVIDSETMKCGTKAGSIENDQFVPGNNYEGDLVVPSSVSDGTYEYTVTGIGRYGFANAKGLTSITLPETITLIPESAFNGCSSLASVSIPETVTSVSVYAFYKCASLSEVKLPSMLTELGYSAFGGCESLTSIVIPESLTALQDQTFAGCGNLKEIDIPASITSFDYGVFRGCSADVEVTYRAEVPVEAGEGLFDSNAYANGTLNMPNATLASVQAVVPWNKFGHIVANDGSYGFVVSGDDFEYEGLWYTVLDAEAKTCKTKDGHGGSATVTSGNIVEGNLTIPERVSVSGQEYEVIGIGAYGFAANSGIISVSIPESVTSIGDYAFFLCDGMESLSLPSTLTSLGERAFSDCVKLASVKLPSSLKELSLGVFQACHNLTTIEFSEGLESIGAVAFESSGSIRTLNLPSTLVRIEESAFAQCNGLREVHLPASLRYLGSRAFFNCVFSSIRLPGNLEEIGERCFSVCKFDTVVYEASSLRTVPDDVFNEYTYQNGVLKTPNATLASVQAVVPWNKFLRITASDGSVAPAGQGEDFEYDGIIYRVLSVSERTCTTKPGGALPEGRDGNIGELTIPQTVSDGVYDYTITAIGSRSFEKAYGITSVSIPASVTIIASSAFLDCSGLTAVSLSEGLQTIDKSAFMGCTGLLSVDVPQGVTSLGAMAFDGCSSIVTATLPESLTTISEMLFTNCSSLETVNIPARVTTIGNQAFLFCERLSSIVIPDGVTFVGYRAFEGCKSLASLVLPESLTEMENSAFYGCSGLTSLTLPASLTVIEHNSFNGCSSLASVMIPESVTDINTYAFRNCSSMKSVTLPSSLSSLGEMVFADSPIETVDYNATSPIVALDNNFDEAVYANATLNMPNATLASVQAVVPWNKFGHIVANDGSYGFAADGDDFEYEGILYTVIDTERKTCKTKEGSRSDSETIAGNIATGDLVIPATVTYDGNDYTVVEIGRYSFWGNTDLTSVSLPETVKASETDAFEECTALTKARFASMEALCDINFRSSPSNPLYLTHHLYIGDEEVTNIVIPESVTAVKAFTFTGGSNITSVTFHEGVTSIGSAAFDGCSGLIAVELPESVASIGEVAFANCSRLTSVILPADVTSIRNYAFSGCDNIATVTYNATEPITASENIFPLNGNVYSSAILNTPNATLASVQATIPWNKFGHIVASDGSYGFVADGDDFEYEGIWYTVIDTEAKNCRTRNGSPVSLEGALTAGNSYDGELTLPSTVIYNSEEFTVTEVGNYGFSGLNGLTSVVIPESVSRIGMDAFYQCEGLTSVSLPSNLSNIEAYAFSECKALTEIVLPDSLRSISTNLFAGCSALRTVAFPSELYSIGERSFSECPLEELTLPEGVTIIGSGAFYGCTRLSKVAIPSSLRDAGNSLFGGCQNIDEVKYRVADPVIMSANTFADLVYSVATLNMPEATLETVRRTEPWGRFSHIIARDGSVGFVADGDEFEYEGVWYTVIDADAKTVRTKNGSVENDESVPGNDYEGDLVVPASVSDGTYEYTVTGIGRYGFANAKGLTSITLPETITLIPESAFNGCSSLASVSIPETVTSVSVYAFYKCASLSEVKLPSMLTELGYSAFGGCESLTSIVIPESLTALQDQTFAGCGNLKEIDIPASITSFEYGVFRGCSADVEVTYRAEVPVEAGEDLFDSNAYSNGTLNMPNATLAAVQAAAPWNKFLRINATDGSQAPAGEGEDFEYEGIWYTVVNAVSKTCKTKEGHYSSEEQVWIGGNLPEGNVNVPTIVSDGVYEYTVVEVGGHGFDGSGVVSVNIPETVTSIGTAAFFECYELTSVSIPENVTYIGENAFDKCVKLESVHLPDGLTKIEANVFQSCTSLSDVNMPSSLRAIEIGAFNQCAITNLELPDGLQSIGFWAFQQNPLVSVTIPASLLSTEEAPFNVCYQIQDVTYLAQAPVELTETLFPDAIYETAVLHAPNATLESIRATVPWNMFVHIMASDGSVGFVAAGDEFDFGGIKYAVIDPDAKTCKTMDAANSWEGDLVIPAAVSYNDEEYSVTEIGHESFAGSNFLLSVTLPGSIISVGENAFADCERLTSLVWTADRQLSSKVVEDIANPNLLVYVNSTEYAPEGLDHNVVAADVCANLVLTPGCPFTPVRRFTAEHSEMTKSFTQQTPIEGCAGWETLALPFEPTSIKASDGRSLAPFAALTDIATQCPFWLYEADAAGEWKEATAIRQSIPYLISMPNNEEYSIQYCIDGDVTFSSDERNEIAPSTTAPYAVTWNSGREFRSLWIPLTESEASKALGLNVGISDLTDDEGQLLAPGSAFHADVTPKPMEAYVTRIDARRSMPVRGGQVYVGMLTADDGLRIAVDFGSITITSDRDRTADVMTTDGIVIRHALIKAGETCRIDNLTRGIYLVAGRKITVK